MFGHFTTLCMKGLKGKESEFDDSILTLDIKFLMLNKKSTIKSENKSFYPLFDFFALTQLWASGANF